MYGCDNKADQESCRILPFILSKISPLFDFKESRFNYSTSKEATARIALFKELRNCPQVFTLESTFSGITQGQLSGKHINERLLESMGKDVLRALML